MHGRQKKERTAEEEEAKKKEQCKKVAAYRHAMGIIFEKRGKNELDEELMKITGQVLAVNPDIGTLWNIRKEVLSVLKQTDYTSFCDVVVPKELDFTEFCLKNNPKSYGGWHHRLWLMKETNFSKVASELKLLAKYLEYDDRNFHCWDYRRYLLDNCSEVTLEQELEFTTEKISSNFSNFSSWHLRSKLLPKLSRDYLEEELELIRNAVFTDPKDQSAWFYHRWLLKSQLQSEVPFLIGYHHTGSKLILILSSKAPSPKQLNVQVVTNGKSNTSQWSNPWNQTCSKLWEYSLPENSEIVLLQADGSMLKEFNCSEITINNGDIKKAFPAFFDAETQPKSEKLMTLLKEELVWVKELQELEPDIKWPISTLILLLRMIDFVGYKSDILKYLEILSQLDSQRINYYLDIRSKYLIEWKLIEDSKTSSLAIDLSGLGLTALYYPERLCFHSDINLSGNTLKNSEPFRALRNCNSLNISGNKLLEEDIKNATERLEVLKF